MVSPDKKADKRDKRDNGEGSIVLRNDGRWVAKIQIGQTEAGKPKIKSFYGKTEREVKNKLKEYKQELIKHDYAEVKKTTVKEYMNDWLYNVKVNDLKPSSLDRKEATLINQVYPLIGDTQIAALSAADVQAMVNKLKEQGLSYSTIKKAYEAVSECFKLAYQKREVLYNPIVGITLPQNIRRSQDDIVYFNDDEIKLIIAEATRKHKNNVSVYRLGYAIVLLLYTGMRIGEALALEWPDVDSSNNTIRIVKNVKQVKNRQNSDSKYIIVEQNRTKTKSGQRIIPINKQCLQALQELKVITGNNTKIISTKSNKGSSARNIDRMFRNVLTQCKLPLHGVHALRHTFASLLFRKGVDVKTVSELLGHADTTVTYNTYIHLIQEQKQQAIKLLDEL